MSTPRRRPTAAPQPITDPITESTHAHQWKQAAQTGELYALPGSGHVARLRRPSLTAMAAEAGYTPNPISAAVLRFLANSDDVLTRPSDEQLIAAFKKNARAFVEIAALAFVSPALVLDREPDYDQNEIGPQDVSDLDYIWITGRLTEGSAADLASFRVA